MHDRRLEHQQALGPDNFMGHADAVEIDIGPFVDALKRHAGAATPMRE
jgi:hypothetical protein